jgi:mannose-6-phosphate isomerase-like protein (cupin superfamily)
MLSVRKEVLDNEYYFRVLRTTSTMQLTTMTIPFGGEIPKETHPGTTQLLYILQGTATLISGEDEREEYGGVGSSMWVPPGTEHRVVSGKYISLKTIDGSVLEMVDVGKGCHSDSTNESLKLMSVYSPPVHSYDKVIREYSGVIMPIHGKHVKISIRNWM